METKKRKKRSLPFLTQKNVECSLVVKTTIELSDREVESGSKLSISLRDKLPVEFQHRRIQQRDVSISLKISADKKKFLLDLQARYEDTIPEWYGYDHSIKKRHRQEKFRSTFEDEIGKTVKTPVEVTFPGWHLKGRKKLVLMILARKLSGYYWTEVETSETQTVLIDVTNNIQLPWLSSCSAIEHNMSTDEKGVSEYSINKEISQFKFIASSSEKEDNKTPAEKDNSRIPSGRLTVNDLLQVCNLPL